MIYLSDTEAIKEIILDLRQTDILWLDTEVADYDTKHPRLSLIQVLAYPYNLNGDRTYIFDVLDNEAIVLFFIEQIMKNEAIVKVFHYAQFDLKFLGKKEAKNVICTFELAKEFPYYLLPVKKYSLKVLTEHLTNFQNISKEEQSSDWGIRPLSKQQLDYAKMDCVYLAQVYQQLMALKPKIDICPLEDDIDLLTSRYNQIEEQWLFLDSEIQHLKARIKAGMIAQKLEENSFFQISSYQKKTLKTNFQNLVDLAIKYQTNFDFVISLTKDIQEQLGENLEQIETNVEVKEYYNLKAKKQ